MTDASNWASEADRTERVLAWAPRFELTTDEPTGTGIKRIVTSQLEFAAWHARRVQHGDVHVRSVRRTTKRVRAVLRLVRDRIGEEQYRTGNVILRDVARELSDTRSAAVRIETLELLVRWRPQVESIVGGVDAGLAGEATRMHARFGEDVDLAEQLAERLESVAASAQGWQLPDSFVPTAHGLSRTYERGRRAMAKAYADPSIVHFHVWRKQVKYLRHQAEVLSAAQPGPLSVMATRISEIGERLGLDHDLADLGHFVGSERGSVAANSHVLEILSAIADVRLKIQADILPMAKHLYRQPKTRFVAEVTEGWEDWHDAEGTPPGDRDGGANV